MAQYNYRKVDPKLPSNPTNPTMTQPLIDKASRDIVQRYRKVRAGVLDRLQTTDMTAAEIEALMLQIDLILQRWILEGNTPKNLWFAPYTTSAAELGAAQAVASLSKLSATYASARTVEAVVYSDAFLNRVAIAQVADYAEFKELTAAASRDLANVITQAVANGDSVTATAKAITERLEVSASKARMYAQTSLPNTLREARWAENDHARETLDIRCALLWTSALKATTRQSHAAKHGKVLTTEQVRDFYGKDGNRYNCYCSQTDCLIDEEGKLIASPELKAGMKAQREKWGVNDEQESTESKNNTMPTKNEEIKTRGAEVLNSILRSKMKSGRSFIDVAEELLSAKKLTDDSVTGTVAFAEEFRAALYDETKKDRVMAQGIATEGRKTPAKSLVDKAASLLPIEWVRAAEGIGKLHVKTVKTRGFAWTAEKDYSVTVKFGQGVSLDSPKKGDGVVTLGKGEFSTAFHELVHRIQSARPDIDAVFQWEHKRRTEDDPLESLRRIVPNSGYDIKEMAKKDGYINPYFGKEYGEKGALEMMTMTLETLYTSGVDANSYSESYHGAKRLIQLLINDNELAGIGIGVMKWL